MDMRVETASRHDHPLAGDDLSPRANDELRVDAGLDERVPGFADSHDPAVADAEVALHDPPIVEHDGVGDHDVEVRGSLLVPIRRLALPITNDFAAAEDDLLAIDGEVLFDLDDEIGVAQADAVADGRSVMPGVGLAAQFLTHAGRSSGGEGGRLLLFLLQPGFLFR